MRRLRLKLCNLDKFMKCVRIRADLDFSGSEQFLATLSLEAQQSIQRIWPTDVFIYLAAPGLSCGLQDLQLQHVGFFFFFFLQLCHVGSISLTRDGTQAPALQARSFNRRATRKVPGFTSLDQQSIDFIVTVFLSLFLKVTVGQS